MRLNGQLGETPPSPTVVTASPDVSVRRSSERDAGSAGTAPTTPPTTYRQPDASPSAAAAAISPSPSTGSVSASTASVVNFTASPLTVLSTDPTGQSAPTRLSAAMASDAQTLPYDPAHHIERVPVTDYSQPTPATILVLVPPPQPPLPQQQLQQQQQQQLQQSQQQLQQQPQQPPQQQPQPQLEAESALPTPAAVSDPSSPSLTPAPASPTSPVLTELAVPPASPVHPPLPTEVALTPLPPPPSPIDAGVIRSLVHPPPPPFPFNRRDHPVYSGPLDGTVALSGKYSYRYASGWYYVGSFRDSLRRGDGELYYSNGGDGYVLQPPADYDSLAPTYNRFISEGHADMKAMELMKHYPEAFEPAGPRPAFRKSNQCEFPGCSGMLFYRPRHHCRQCGLNFCADHGCFATTLPRLYYPKDAPQKVCQSCYENDKLISKTVTGDIYVGSFKFNYVWGRGVYIIQTKKERYEGEFDEGRMEGRGSYRFSNGDIFTGDYRGDKREGRGTLQYRLNGLQQLQQDREELLSQERQKQQAAEDKDPGQASAIAATIAPLSLPDSYPQQKGEVLYCGSWANDVPEGSGVFVTAALFYVGEFAAGERTGRASIVMKSTGERYEGTVRGGVREGQGMMISPWGLYEGEWRDNQRSGKGRWEYRRKQVPSCFPALTVSDTAYLNVYSGQFVSDAATGFGRQVYWDGSHYEGGHLNLLPHGRGVMTYCNHDQFVGDWVRGQRQGRGKMVFSTAPFRVVERVDREGQPVPPSPQEVREAELVAAAPRPLYIEYTGDWSGDLPHGQGECLYPDGSVYSGSFASGLATGQGRTQYANGDWYEGGNAGGIRQGRGVYTWSGSGNSYDGEWKAGKRFIPDYLSAVAGGVAALDDQAHWAFLLSHRYTHAETGEVYEGESQYGEEGDWAKSAAERQQRSRLSAAALAGLMSRPPHPSDPDSPAFVRHGLGVLRATPTNTVYSHWMGHWLLDLREGLGRLYLLPSASSPSSSSSSSAAVHPGHIVEGVWAADLPPHTGHVQAVAAEASRSYSFHGLLSASILPIAGVAEEMDDASLSSDVRMRSSVDLHTWSRLTLSRLQRSTTLDRSVSPSLLCSPSSAAFVHVAVPLSSAFALLPSGVGSFHFPNGDVYYGQMLAGKAEGKGQARYVYPDAAAAGTQKPQGSLSHQVYVGRWRAGRRDGLGQLTYADRSCYTGDWRRGDRHGLGIFTASLPSAASPPQSASASSSSLYEYEGDWANDRPNGRGVLRCGQFVYEGELSVGLMHGSGRIQWQNGDSYSGMWRRGRREGSGHFLSAEDHAYTGSLWYGRYHGFGSSQYALTIPLQPPAASSTAVFSLDPLTPAAVVIASYTGDHYYGFKTGRGHLRLSVVDKLQQSLIAQFDYTGGFQGDLFSGSGVFSVYKQSGQTAAAATAASSSSSPSPSAAVPPTRVLVSRYDGEWLSGKRHGAGAQWFSDGRIYTGEWVKDHPHGSGRMQYPLQQDHSGEQERDALPVLEVAEYTGAWAMGVWRGSGSVLYSNGDAYTGEIADNHRHGSGCLTLANGDTAKGVWKDDKKDGRLLYSFYRPLAKGGKSLPAAAYPPSSSSPSHYLATVESQWKEDVLDGVVLFRFLPSTTAHLTAILTKWTDGLLSHSHPFQVMYAEQQQQVYQGQLVATTTEPYHFDLYALAEMGMQKSNPAVLSVSTTAIPSFEDCVQRLPILASLSPVFPVTAAFFPFHVFAVVFCHTRVSRQGVGLLRTSSGEEYVGQWKNNVRHGRGQQVFVSSSTSGSLSSPTEEQSVYVGSWQDDVMHGRGSLYIESRQVKLTTMFARGKANTEIKGKGRLENYVEQSVYAGDLSSLTILNGIGQLVYCDGSSYQGTFVNGQPEGLGRKIESDGSVHIGYYLRGMRWGKGMSVSAEGVVERGSWQQDKKEGMFTREKAGQMIRVKYQDGQERWSGK